MKLPYTCTQSLSKCIENDHQLSKLMEQYKGMSSKMINMCLYNYNNKCS